MRRRNRIVSSAAAAGAVLAGAAVTIASTPHQPTPATASVRQTEPRNTRVDPTLVTLGAQSRASQRRSAELNKAIARAQAKIRAEALRHAAAARLRQQQAQQAQAAQSAAATAQGGSVQAAAPPVTVATQPVRVTTLPPVVHTTTRASGSTGSSQSDEPGDHEPGSDDGGDSD